MYKIKKRVKITPLLMTLVNEPEFSVVHALVKTVKATHSYIEPYDDKIAN
jgi:hypothetical protein